VTQPPPSPSPWAPPEPAWTARQEDPPQPADSDTAVIPAVEPDTAAIQVDPSQVDTAAHPLVADRRAQPLGPKPPVLLNPLPRAPRAQPTSHPNPGPHTAPPPPAESDRSWDTTQEVASPWGPPQASPPAQALHGPPHTPPPAPSQPSLDPPPFAAPQALAGPPAMPAQAPMPGRPPMPGHPPMPTAQPSGFPPAYGPPPPGYAPMPAPPPPGTGRATTTKGWWRRNLWGLIALLPILGLALGPTLKESLDLYNRVDAHDAVLPGGDGWVSYSDARIRLVSFGPATDLKTYDGEPFQPPARTKVWKATLAFDAASKDAVTGCTLALEDSEGRIFSANPTELSGARARFPACTPEDDNAPSPWQVDMYFMTPEAAQPAAVRVTRGLQLPRYARLETS
jgi:hypothetical protein